MARGREAQGIPRHPQGDGLCGLSSSQTHSLRPSFCQGPWACRPPSLTERRQLPAVPTPWGAPSARACSQHPSLTWVNNPLHNVPSAFNSQSHSHLRTHTDRQTFPLRRPWASAWSKGLTPACWRGVNPPCGPGLSSRSTFPPAVKPRRPEWRPPGPPPGRSFHPAPALRPLHRSCGADWREAGQVQVGGDGWTG